jgi:hypothetical protein
MKLNCTEILEDSNRVNSQQIPKNNCDSNKLNDPLDIIKLMVDKRAAILIVDDEPFNILAFKLVLKRFNELFIDNAFNGL